MQDIERCYSVFPTSSQAAESFPPLRESLPEIRIIQILFKLYLKDLNETKMYILQVSVLTKLCLISFILLLSTYSYYCYHIEVTFWLFFWLFPSAVHLLGVHRRIWQWPGGRSLSLLELWGDLQSIQTNKAPKWKWQCLFCSTLKVLLYDKEKWQETDLWQHQQVNRSNNIIEGGRNFSKVNHRRLNIKSKRSWVTELTLSNSLKMIHD